MTSPIPLSLDTGEQPEGPCLRMWGCTLAHTGLKGLKYSLEPDLAMRSLFLVISPIKDINLH